MTFIADASVPDPVVRALQAVRFDIRRLGEIAAGDVSDRAAAHSVLEYGGILLTLDLAQSPSPYVGELIENGLTVVSLRWSASTPLDWQQMVDAILRKAESWIQCRRRRALAHKRQPRRRQPASVRPSSERPSRRSILWGQPRTRQPS